jgi:hypothetical protein
MPEEIAKKLKAELTGVMIEGLPGFAHVVGAKLSDARKLQLMTQLSDEGVRRLECCCRDNWGVAGCSASYLQ